MQSSCSICSISKNLLTLLAVLFSPLCRNVNWFKTVILGSGLILVSNIAIADIEATPERLARGEYLVTSVLDCASCHTQRRLDVYNWRPDKRMMLAGGVDFRVLGENAISSNLTPYGIGEWSDEQLLTAITTGLRPDGRVLNPAMPYVFYGQLPGEELASIIVYLRTLEPVTAGPFEIDRPESYAAVIPAIDMFKRPDPTASELERGKYLVTIATCDGCHGPDLSGGAEFPMSGYGVFRPANLTPHETGIGSWSKSDFIGRFTSMRSDDLANVKVAPGEPNLFMPWWLYSGMSERDLGAIYAYLRTVAPVEKIIVKFEPLPGEPVKLNFSEIKTVGSNSQQP